MGDELSTDEVLQELRKSIAELYLKIKRCSKDVSATESFYIENLETEQDREERKMIWKMDPRLVLQYINISIDVIINLKFEDIENKMIEKNNKGNNSFQKSLNEHAIQLRKSMLESAEHNVFKKKKQLKETLADETPKKIRE